MTANPHDSPKTDSLLTAKPVRSRKRLVAYSLIAAPFLLAFPLRYWALNHAGGWFVSTDLEPDHRSAFLGLMYFGMMLAISVWCFFGASIFLWRDRFYPVVSACAAVVFGVLAIPAGIFLAIGLNSYLEYGSVCGNILATTAVLPILQVGSGISGSESRMATGPYHKWLGSRFRSSIVQNLVGSSNSDK